MQSDDMIWSVINKQFCSFQTTIGRRHGPKDFQQRFCKNPYSVTGLCNRTSCPLANSKYATLREDQGRVHLYIKTVERCHSPKNTWERILLSRNYSKALATIEEHLQYNVAQVLIHRNKQRLTKIHQYLIRMRKLELKERSGRKAKISSIHRKLDQREERRERKALMAAKLEDSITQELTERLAKGTYGDIYNFPETSYQKALQQQEEKEDAEEDAEADETTLQEDEDDETEEEESMVEYVEDFESDDEEEEEEEEEVGDYLGNGQWGARDEDDDDDDDDEDDAAAADDDDESDESAEEDEDDDDDDQPKKKKPKKDKKPAAVPPRPKPPTRGPRIEIEYEDETEDGNTARAVAAKTSW